LPTFIPLVRQVEPIASGGSDPSVIPLANHSSENVEINVARQLHLACNARNIVRYDDHASGDRDHDRAAGLGAFAVIENFVAAGEVNSVCKKAPDALSAPDDIIGKRD
jgi:hypothetical protein